MHRRCCTSHVVRQAFQTEIISVLRTLYLYSIYGHSHGLKNRGCDWLPIMTQTAEEDNGAEGPGSQPPNYNLIRAQGAVNSTPMHNYDDH